MDLFIRLYAQLHFTTRVLAYSEKHEKVVPFRVDRICRPMQLEENRVPEPEGFNIEDYASKIFDMYDGEEQTVVLECKNELMRVLVDFFGEDFQVEPAGEDTFFATVNVSTSKTFFGWVFKFGGQIRIVGPESVRLPCSSRIGLLVNSSCLVVR